MGLIVASATSAGGLTALAVKLSLKKNGVKENLLQRLSELGITYQGSPIVEGPGKRHFDDSLRGGKGIGGRFLLFLDSEAESSTKEEAKQLGESFSNVVDLRFFEQHGLVLVRPDGYVAYSSHKSDTAAVQAVQSVLQRQSKSPALSEKAARPG